MNYNYKFFLLMASGFLIGCLNKNGNILDKPEPIAASQMRDILQDAQDIEHGKHTKPAPIYTKTFSNKNTQNSSD